MPAADRPPISVVIPCFNQAQFLSAAISSVLGQRHVTMECIVVDDGSSDDTSAVAGELGVRLIRQPRRGVSEARNAGLAAASGDLVVFLDADDELMPDALTRAAVALGADSDAAVVVGRCRPMSARGEVLPVRQPDIDPSDLYNEWLSQNFVWTPGAAMFRRNALLGIGGFPARLGPAADYAVYLRLARDGRVRLIAEELVRYRQHGASMSRDPARMLRATLAVLRLESRGVTRPLRRRIRHGRRQWRDWYGDQIVDSLRADWHARHFGRRQLVTLMTLVRECPRTALRHTLHKARLALAGDPLSKHGRVAP